MNNNIKQSLLLEIYNSFEDVCLFELNNKKLPNAAYKAIAEECVSWCKTHRNKMENCFKDVQDILQDIVSYYTPTKKELEKKARDSFSQYKNKNSGIYHGNNFRD